MGKKALFDDEQDVQLKAPKLKVNEDFARRFEVSHFFLKFALHNNIC